MKHDIIFVLIILFICWHHLNRAYLTWTVCIRPVYKQIGVSAFNIWTLLDYFIRFAIATWESGDNCIQNYHLERYIVGAVKRDFRTYIRQYTSPNENFEYVYPHSNALLQFDIKLKRCKPHKAARHPTQGGVIDYVKLFLIVYLRIYCRKFLT